MDGGVRCKGQEVSMQHMCVDRYYLNYWCLRGGAKHLHPLVFSNCPREGCEGQFTRFREDDAQ